MSPNLNLFFEAIMNKATNADDAFTGMRQLSIERNGDPSFAYINMNMLLNKFTKDSVIKSVSMFMYLDIGDFNKSTDNRIKTAEKKFARWLGQDQFYQSFEKHNIGAFLDGDVLYVIHPCVKPGECKWQCTSFGRKLGPLGDTTRDTIEEIVELDNPVIPLFAGYIPFNEIDELLMNQFCDTKKMNLVVESAEQLGMTI